MSTFKHEFFVQTVDFTLPIIIFGIAMAAALAILVIGVRKGFFPDGEARAMVVVFGLVAAIGLGSLTAVILSDTEYTAYDARDQAREQVVQDVVRQYPELSSLYIAGGVTDGFITGTREYSPRVEGLNWEMLVKKTPLTTWPGRKACVIKTAKVDSGTHGSDFNPHSGYAEWSGRIVCE